MNDRARRNIESSWRNYRFRFLCCWSDWWSKRKSVF